MGFKSNRELEGTKIGTRVRLTRDVDVLSGRFEQGTIMTVTGHGDRGLDLVDDQGNRLIETGILDKFYTVIGE